MFRIIMVLPFLLLSGDLFAGVLGLDPDAPILLKTAEWLLMFMSKSIQHQALAYVTWFVTIMVAIQGAARGIAELLGLFAMSTKTDVDNRIMNFMIDTAKWAGKVIGWFGVGFPKSLK